MFVQVIQGRTSQPQAVAEAFDRWKADLAPGAAGRLAISHDQGAYTMVMYVGSEAEARDGESKDLPPELRAQMEEMNQLNIGEPEFLDLRQPFLSSPR